MRSRHALSCALALTCLVLASPASAEPQTPGRSGGSDDAVLLKDGTLFRGTILELIPGRTVRIVLTTGETRVIPMETVNYAGPGSALASTSAPAGSQLELRANKPAVTFFWRGDSARLIIDGESGHAAQTYRRICTAPCEAMLPPGTYLMALASGHGDPVVVDDPVVIEGPSSLRAKHTSYAPLRIAGAILGVGAAIGGIYLMGSGLLRSKETCDSAGNCATEPDIDTQKVLIGAGVLIGGAIIGGLMQSKKDGAEIMISPLVSPARRSRLPGIGPAGHDALSSGPSLSPGLTISAIF